MFAVWISSLYHKIFDDTMKQHAVKYACFTSLRKLSRCKGVESDKRTMIVPLSVIISTSFLRSFFRKPPESFGLQEINAFTSKKKENETMHEEDKL